ncbi:helix-turn-helix domain-containing protein [Kitasatospora sp. NPDC048298]|uniref:helix-turn-helix domain-containing protein n=1 Tax=Kitasatospora sp. NPDC048298 TaxID=3364049 RepID=UPI00370FD177
MGIELRKMRDSVGQTTAQAAAVFNLDRTKITQVEKGHYPITAERVRVLAEAFGEADAEYVAALASMAGERHKGWWDEYRGFVPQGFLDICELEYYSMGMQSYQICHPPGPMQSERYCRAIFQHAQSPLTPRVIETRVEQRLRRSQTLMTEGAHPYTAIVYEAALRAQFGGRDVTREQLDWMLELSLRPHVTLRVVTFESGGFMGSGQAIIYANGPVPRLDTVQYDSVDGPIFLHTTEHLNTYRTIIKRMTDRSLSVEGSRDLIAKIKKEI